MPGTTADPAGMVRAGNGFRFQSEPWDGFELPDVLIVAGGTLSDPKDPNKPAGIVKLAMEPNFTEKITNQQAAGRIVASVCTGAFGIVGARVAQGRTITSHPGVLDQLRAFAASLNEDVTIIGPDATDPEPNARVVDDCNLVTCGGVTSGINEAVYLVQKYWPSQLDNVRNLWTTIIRPRSSRSRRRPPRPSPAVPSAPRARARRPLDCASRRTLRRSSTR